MDEMQKHLLDLNNKKVVVWTGTSIVRSNFEPAVSLMGILESLNTDEHRILVNDQTYSYFKTDNVDSIVEPLSGGKVETDGAIAIIRIFL